MSNKRVTKPLAIALGAAFATSLTGASIASAAENPFGMTELSSGYMLADSLEGKCGEGKTKAEGKDGEGMNESAEKMKEGKCGEGKKKDAEKAQEGKCGAAN